MNEIIPQTGGWVGIVDGQLLLVRTYADESLTVAANDGTRWGPEVELESEPVGLNPADGVR